MAFRASSVTPAEAYRLVKGNAVQLWRNVDGFITHLTANDVDYDMLQDIYLTLKRSRDQLNALKTIPGLAKYAQAQEDDSTYDVAAEFTALLGHIATAIAWLEVNIPTSVTAKAVSTWNTGTLISDTFTPAQAATLRAQLQAVVDSIV